MEDHDFFGWDGPSFFVPPVEAALVQDCTECCNQAACPLGGKDGMKIACRNFSSWKNQED